MPGTASRRLLDTRSICVGASARDDGLWDLVAGLAAVLPMAAKNCPRWYTGNQEEAITEGQGQ